MTPTPNGARVVRGVVNVHFSETPNMYAQLSVTLPEGSAIVESGTPVLVLPDTDADRERRVEAVAKALYLQSSADDHPDEYTPWGELAEPDHVWYRKQARAALAAMAGEAATNG